MEHLQINKLALWGLCCAMALPLNTAFAQTLNEQTPQWGCWHKWGNQQDGTYINPILPEDYSDIDCIQVGNDYYAISSTFQFSPGMVILHSRNMVDWTVCGHAVNDLTQISPELNWDRMNRYAKGIWAGSIRHHKGLFYVVFGTPDEGFFMTTAPKAEGPWAPLTCLLAQDGWDDCCIAWDEKDVPYLVGTCFKDHYKTYLIPFNEQRNGLLMDKALLLNEGNGREASKIIAHNGWYYLVFSEHINGKGRYVMTKRARKLTGPYNEEQQLTRNTPGTNEPNQGGIVQGPQGEWLFLTHHGTGDWAGRVVSLLPVTWTNGWPIIGEPQPDGVGTMTWCGKMKRSKRKKADRKENFNHPQLSKWLEWNYQPRTEMISLTERKGWLRLKAFAPLKKEELLTFGNILTERVVRTNFCTVETKVDLQQLNEGDRCGMCHFSKASSSVGALKKDGKLFLEQSVNNQWTTLNELPSTTLWLRSSWGLDGVSTYSYSTDGKHFTHLTPTVQLQWGYYRGDRVGIFCSGNTTGGWADFDYLDFKQTSST